jgi:hypothetical protein
MSYDGHHRNRILLLKEGIKERGRHYYPPIYSVRRSEKSFSMLKKNCVHALDLNVWNDVEIIKQPRSHCYLAILCFLLRSLHY